MNIEGERGVRTLEVDAALQRTSQPWCSRLPLMHNRQIRFLEPHVNRERRFQQPLRQGHSSECQIDGEADVQRDDLTSAMGQTPYTLQLSLRIRQRVGELRESKPLRHGLLHGQLTLEARFRTRAGKLHLERGAATYNVWEMQELLQIGQINLRRVQLDILQLLAMHSTGEFNGLIVMHQMYASEVKPLWPKDY